VFLVLLKFFCRNLRIFLDEIPSGLPPIRGIEHQIDFVLEAAIPNQLAYRRNLEETKKLQRQVEELMSRVSFT